MTNKTGNQVVGADGTMVDEIEIEGVKHVKVSATVPEDASFRMKINALGSADGHVLESEITKE